MISNEISFTVEKRYVGRSAEWALFARFKDCDRWCLYTWDKEPSEKSIKDVKDLVLRSFEVYHRHLEIPPFNLEVTK